MQALDINEYAFVELAALKPIGYVPPVHKALADALRRRGLIAQDGDRWYPTALGLTLAGRTLH
jgi:hypothetical protein